MKIKKILIKKAKVQTIEGKKRTVQKQEFHNIRSTNQAFSTKFGSLKKEELQKNGKVKIKNQEYYLFDPALIDQLKNIKRTSQMIPVKDIGLIMAETGINPNSVILDAGSGSGGISCFLATIAKQITTYEVNKDNIPIVRQNIKDLELTNITSKEGDITKASTIKEKNIDVFTLDIPNPEKAVGTAKKVLKVGGFIVNYSPNITQSQDFANKIKSTDEFLYIKTVELIEREWKLDGKIARPISDSMVPSGFLTFARKIN